MNKATTEKSVLQQPSTTPASAVARRPRPARPSFDNPGKLKFPPIPGYRLFVASVDDETQPHEYAKYIDIGYTPVQASEIGYDKLGHRPLKPDDKVEVNLGRGVRGILLKIPEEWYQEDVDAFVKHNNQMFVKRKDEADKSADKDLIMMKAELSGVKT